MSVSLWSCPPPPVSRREILRYMKCDTATSKLDALIDACLDVALPLLSYRVCYTRLPIKQEGIALDLGAFRVHSRDLQKNLAGCREVLVLAATVGIGLDRTITRFGHTSPAQALCLQAIGAERIEALCDAFVREMEASLSLRPRFSPGYGDLPLTVQRDLFALLSPSRHIGLTLTSELLMSPTKSVTAFAGIEVSS